MIKSIKGLTILIVLFVLSCQSKQKYDDSTHENNDSKTLYDQAMNAHDEAMIYIDSIHFMKEKLKTIIEKSSTITHEKGEDIKNAMDELEEAGDAMMDWMHDFDPESLTDSTIRKSYLETEIKKIKQINRDIVNSIEKAKEKI